jgi:hypothetical protein
MPTHLDDASVSSFLRGLRYPLWRGDLIRRAEAHRTSDEVIAALRDIPDREYRSLEEVMDHLSGRWQRPG